MPNTTATNNIAVADIVEAATTGVLRAMEARKIGQNFTDKNGFFVKIDITCGGYPLPVLKELGGAATLGRAAVEAGG